MFLIHPLFPQTFIATQMIEYITSINNTHHFGLFNHKNSYCHYISILQRLHTSTILSEQLKSFDNALSKIDSKYEEYKPFVTKVMYPVIEYSKYIPKSEGSTSNVAVYERIKEYFITFENEYVIQSAKEGYFPHYVMTFIFMPIIHLLFPEKFEQILKELAIDTISFVNNAAEANVAICGKDAFFVSRYQQFMLELYDEMMKDMPEMNDVSNFCATTLEVYPNKGPVGGHAITLIKASKDLYYIIDDQSRISTLQDYYIEHKSRLYRISVRDINETTIANMNAILKAECNIAPDAGAVDNGAKFTKRVTRYELNFEHNFDDVSTESLLKEEYKKGTQEEDSDERDKDSNKVNNRRAMGMNGGQRMIGDYIADDMWSQWKWLFIIFMVCVCVVMILVKDANGETMMTKIVRSVVGWVK